MTSLLDRERVSAYNRGLCVLDYDAFAHALTREEAEEEEEESCGFSLPLKVTLPARAVRIRYMYFSALFAVSTGTAYLRPRRSRLLTAD